MDRYSDAIAAIVLGIYLLVVFSKGNSRALLAELQKEADFIPWFAGVIAVIILKDHLPAQIGNMLGTMLVLIFLIQTGSKLFPAIDQFFKGA